MFGKILRKVFKKSNKQRLSPSSFYTRSPELGAMDDWELIPIEKADSIAPATLKLDRGSMGYSDVDILLSENIEAAVIKPSQAEQAVPIIQDLLVLYVLAPNGQFFLGYELLQALLAGGLRYGHKRIFHRHEDLSGKGEVLFSLASATEPGCFDIENMGAFACSGLCLFASLQALQPQLVWQTMLETARQLADDLGGAVYDAKRQLLTDTSIAQIEKILDAHYVSDYTA